MCGRFTLHHTVEELEERFAAELAAGSVGETEARYNVAPTQDVLVVTQNGVRHLQAYHWGLIPSWAKDTGHRQQDDQRTGRNAGREARVSHGPGTPPLPDPCRRLLRVAGRAHRGEGPQDPDAHYG